jgi:hypothetical protein
MSGELLPLIPQLTVNWTFYGHGFNMLLTESATRSSNCTIFTGILDETCFGFSFLSCKMLIDLPIRIVSMQIEPEESPLNWYGLGKPLGFDTLRVVQYHGLIDEFMLQGGKGGEGRVKFYAESC